MNIRSKQLYARMQEEIGQAEACCSNEMIRVERCFSIALTYWGMIRTISDSYLFLYETEEIEFFKHIQPLFMAAMEYYMLLYQAILFKPSHNKDELLSYWLGQLKRTELFFSRHHEFCSYYMNDGNDKDLFYFRRPENPDGNKGRFFFCAGRPLSPCQMAARMLGFQQYRQYIEDELKSLSEGERPKVFSAGRICA